MYRCLRSITSRCAVHCVFRIPPVSRSNYVGLHVTAQCRLRHPSVTSALTTTLPRPFGCNAGTDPSHGRSCVLPASVSPRSWLHAARSNVTSDRTMDAFRMCLESACSVVRAFRTCRLLRANCSNRSDRTSECLAPPPRHCDTTVQSSCHGDSYDTKGALLDGSVLLAV